MSKLSRELSSWIKHRMDNEIRSLPSGSRECRAVFSGPPELMIAEIFRELAGDGRLLSTEMPDGSAVSYPVVLQVHDLPANGIEARADRSGLALFHGLAGIRNSHDAGIFLTLVPPGAQASDTHESTRKPFGVASTANDGGSPISTWWNDPFIQQLVVGGLGEGDEGQLAQAKRLVHEAIVAADSAMQHDVSRVGSWTVLERLWELRDSGLSLDARVSLATGFAPSEDGHIDAMQKASALASLVERFERSSFGSGAEQLKEQCGRAGVAEEHIDAFMAHLRSKCDLVTALKRSMPFFYAPDGIATAPEWWFALTVQKWEILLEDEGGSTPEIGIACANPMAFQLKGFVPVVRGAARIVVQLPEGMEGTQVRVTREGPGGAANRREWMLPGSASAPMEFVDDAIPLHRTPFKYVAETVPPSTAKRATVRLISLSSWEPGLIVCSRTATKGRVPKIVAAKPIETILEMSGAGRHYLDLYARPGVEILSTEAICHGDDDEVIEPSRIGRITDDEYGMEVEAGGERFYELQIRRPGAPSPENFRINLVADESSPEECGSYFEFHLAMNSRRDGSRQPRAVHANSTSRSVQLQGWMIDEECVERSFYPFVLAPDYASQWGRREWTSVEDTIFSSARFLNDPRPTMEEMRPPQAFIQARKDVFAKVRGNDGNDLVESANLGKLLATDAEFELAVGIYVRSYLDWLLASPSEAPWCDIGLVMALEADGETLEQVPNAIVVSPLHPVRLAWQCLAQRAMYMASRKLPCPAASIMDPDCIPDSLALPLRDATGGINETVYFSVECSSDYWGILWNTQRFDRLSHLGASAPLDREMDLLVGGISSGFSKSQVHRALDDVCEMLVAKPVISVLVSSAAGQNNACNDGILSWGRRHYASDTDEVPQRAIFGANEIHVFDERSEEARPDDAEISNLAEDTRNAVQWYSGNEQSPEHDIAIIAQLETANAEARPAKLTSPLGFGGLVRSRIREQQAAGGGQFLRESRVATSPRVSGDGLADTTAKAIATLEGLGPNPTGYVFAPSVSAIRRSLDKAEFAAVSSSAVDPACFLGNWLEGTFLWDYELPSYSGRSGDSNGYYLLSRIKPLDLETMKVVLQRLPQCADLPDEQLSAIVHEIARRGIPTVRGLSAGNSGAAGDLGLFVATRLLQDSFRASGGQHGLLRPWEDNDGVHKIALIIAVDPFQRYLDDLAKAVKKQNLHRPDLMVIGLEISDSAVHIKLTPIEVKNRSGTGAMPHVSRLEALGQAKSLSSLLGAIHDAAVEEELVLWDLAYQNLLTSMIGYGFRVYSQHLAETGKAGAWASLHMRTMQAILASEAVVEIDSRGRLIVIDGSSASAPRDTDGDSFQETIEVSQSDASVIVREQPDALYDAIKTSIGDWRLFPSPPTAVLDSSMEPADAVLPTGTGDGATPSPIPSTERNDVASPVRDDDPRQSNSAPEPSTADAEHSNSASNVSQTGLTLRVGDTLDGFQAQVRTLNLGHTALNQLNMGVVGDLGTGKTQLLKSLIYQIASGAADNRGVKPNVLIFDYKKDYSSEDFVQATGARVIRPQHIPLNLFDLSNSSQSISPWLARYNFFADIIDKIYSGVGPVQRSKLKSAIQQAYTGRKDGEYPTVYDVHANYQDSLKGGADSVSGIISDMVDMELFALDPEAIVSSKQFLDGVVVIALNELGQDDRTKNMIVAIMLNVFYEHMLKIPKRPFLGENRDMRVVDSMVLVDEADNIMKYEFDVLRSLLLQGREFGVGVILASQYLSHFKTGSSDYKEPLLTWFLHKVPNLRPQELASLGLSEQSSLQQMAERIKSLQVHECMYKTHDISGEFIVGAPFYQREDWT